MGLSRSKPPAPAWALLRVGALASTLLALSGPAAEAADLAPSAGPAVRVQYQQDPYRQPPPDGYEQGPYRQGQRGYDDPRDGYGQDRYGGQGPRQYDERDRYGDQNRYGQGGGGRSGGRGRSFQQSCGDIQQNGNTLSAVCDNGRGQRVATSINTRRCGRSDIGNQRGILQCGNVRGNGRPLD